MGRCNNRSPQPSCLSGLQPAIQRAALPTDCVVDALKEAVVTASGRSSLQFSCRNRDERWELGWQREAPYLGRIPSKSAACRSLCLFGGIRD